MGRGLNLLCGVGFRDAFQLDLLPRPDPSLSPLELAGEMLLQYMTWVKFLKITGYLLQCSEESSTINTLSLVPVLLIMMKNDHQNDFIAQIVFQSDR